MYETYTVNRNRLLKLLSASCRRLVHSIPINRHLTQSRYCCNQDKAVEELSDAFGISDDTRDIDEKNFSDWMKADRDTRGPTNKARKWRPSYDWGRQLVCMAFGLDFGSIILPSRPHRLPIRRQTDQDADKSPHVIHRQRLAIYMQRDHEAVEPSPRMTRFNTGRRNLQPYSKANTMVILEYLSGHMEEIADIPFLLSLDVTRPSSSLSQPDDPPLDLPSTVIQTVLTHTFSRVRQAWTDQLLQVHDEYTALEDRVYERPSDSSVAQHLWAMSQHLHDMLKLINRHAKLI